MDKTYLARCAQQHFNAISNRRSTISPLNDYGSCLMAPSSRPLRVCLVSPALAPYHREGGIGQYLQLLAEGLGQRGHRVTVIGSGLHEYGHDVDVQEVFQESYGCSIALPAFRPRGRWFRGRFFALRAAAAVSRYLQEQRSNFDIVEASNWLGFGAFIDRSHLPSVVRVSTPALQGWGPSPNLQLVNWLEGRSCRHADLVIGHSQAILEETARLYGSARTPSTVIPLAVADIATKHAGPPDDAVHVLYIGRAEKRKGTDILLRALQRTLAVATTLHVTFLGSEFPGFFSENRDLRGLWNALLDSYPTRIENLGIVPEETKLESIARAHWLVVPSRFESFGLIVPEAMRAGTPVLVSRGGALPDIAALSPDNRVYGEPTDVDALASALIELDRLGPLDAIAKRERTRRAYLTQLTPPAFIDATLASYVRVLSLNDLEV